MTTVRREKCLEPKFIQQEIKSQNKIKKTTMKVLNITRDNLGFPLPWDPPRWVTGPVFFSLAGGPASPSLCRYSETLSIKQPLFSTVEKKTKCQNDGRKDKNSQRLHSFHWPPVGFFFSFSSPRCKNCPCFLQIESCNTSTARATQLNVCSVLICGATVCTIRINWDR